jgi:hypothetical protein
MNEFVRSAYQGGTSRQNAAYLVPDYWLCTLGYKTRFHDERIELMIGFQTYAFRAA